VTTLRLREWSTTSNLALTPRQRDALRQTFGALVQPTAGSTDTFDVTPSNTIGAVRVQDATVLIEPKLPISRVLFLLGYATDPSGFGPGDADLGVADDIVSGVTRLFTTLARKATQRGLLSGYRSEEKSLHTVRGRIDLAEQLRRRPGVDLPLALRFQEYDEDILENQLLLAATAILRRLPQHDVVARAELHRMNEALQNVSRIHYDSLAIPAVTWTRLNEQLRPSVELARLLLSMQSPEARNGGTTTPSLTIDMADLFETFVRTALREALRATEDAFPGGDSCPTIHLDARKMVRLKPDLSLWRERRCTFIGDIKYKRDSGSGHSADLYQLLAYATATRLDEAMLVYALGPPVPRTHHVPAAGVRLHVEHLNLSEPPAGLLQQVQALAGRIATASAPGSAHAECP